MLRPSPELPMAGVVCVWGGQMAVRPPLAAVT